MVKTLLELNISALPITFLPSWCVYWLMQITQKFACTAMTQLIYILWWQKYINMFTKRWEQKPTGMVFAKQPFNTKPIAAASATTDLDTEFYRVPNSSSPDSGQPYLSSFMDLFFINNQTSSLSTSVTTTFLWTLINDGQCPTGTKVNNVHLFSLTREGEKAEELD